MTASNWAEEIVKVVTSTRARILHWLLIIFFIFFITENLAPAELKKLRNKQRKARKKAEQESAQAAQAQVKKDQHHKSRQQGDIEADAPQLDELIPDKLARVSQFIQS